MDVDGIETADIAPKPAEQRGRKLRVVARPAREVKDLDAVHQFRRFFEHGQLVLAVGGGRGGRHPATAAGREHLAELADRGLRAAVDDRRLVGGDDLEDVQVEAVLMAAATFSYEKPWIRSCERAFIF